MNSVYKEYKPDWVLFDIIMKSVNGLKAAERLIKEFSGARFVFVSVYNRGKIPQKASKLGAAGFISKENLFELTRIIQSIINGSVLQNPGVIEQNQLLSLLMAF